MLRNSSAAVGVRPPVFYLHTDVLTRFDGMMRDGSPRALGVVVSEEDLELRAHVLGQTRHVVLHLARTVARFTELHGRHARREVYAYGFLSYNRRTFLYERVFEEDDSIC